MLWVQNNKESFVPSALKSHLQLVRPPGQPPSGERDQRNDTQHNDDELVAALKAGSKEAATPFYYRVRPVVSRTVLRLLRSGEEHDELLQLVMIELVLTIGRFKNQCPLDAWVSTISAHVVCKYLRRKKLERTLFQGLGESASPAYEVPSPSSPASSTLQRGALKRLQRLLESMNPAKAEAFVLHDVHGYDLREVAAILDITVANAQTRLVRGRKELHQLIREDPELATVLHE